MQSRTLALGILVGVAVTLGGSTAFAQATRTWVSGVGDDANPCSRTAPCKTFAGAISKTAAGGEIDAIDSGGFGAVTITKAITIDGHNVMAG
ncbi:MAG: outer membrane protein, partial [bacterium]|nr:outer membrane protein [bacterium]